MGKEGDTKLFWDKSNTKDVELARATFALYKGSGYAAFKMDPTGKAENEQIREFEPDAQNILFTIPIQGG